MTEPDVSELAWSPTEKHIVTYSSNGVLRKWSNIFESPKIVAGSTHNHNYVTLEYSPDDRLIASFFLRTAKLWDASKLSLVWEYSGDKYSSVAFHPSEHRVFFFNGLSVDDVNVEDLGNITVTKRSLDFDVKALVFDPSGITCAAETYYDVTILSADTFKLTTSLPYEEVRAMRFTPDGKHILLVVESKTLVLWDIAANAIIQQLTINIPQTDVWHARISNDCRVVHVRDYKSTCHLIYLTY
jgi:WD40 repeat protein